MSANAPILIATEAVADAELVATLLKEEFDNIHLSTKPEAAVADFEQCRPAVLILAFDTLEKAQLYYLGLYRLSSLAPTIAHRTLILCNAGELWKVYDLCKKSHFDDYVLFWPATNDAPRLRMAVYHLLCDTRHTPADTVSAGEFAAGARRLVQDGEAVARHAEAGEDRVADASRALLLAQQGIGTVLDELMQAVERVSGMTAGAADADAVRALAGSLASLRAEAIPRHMASANASVDLLRQWLDELARHADVQRQSGQGLQRMVERFKPLVLIVDDDPYQHKLLQRVLADAPLRLMFASAGFEALGLMRKLRPDLVLMDVELPDISGIEATRRLVRMPHMASVPVMMITGHSERSLVVECLKAGAVDFAVKPFQKATLLAKIHGALARSPSASDA